MYVVGPSFGVNKMGSFVSQPQAIVKIWRNEIDPFAYFFGEFVWEIQGASTPDMYED